MSGSDTPAMPAPDPGIGQAAQANAAIGNDWLNFSKGAYSTEQGMQSNINNVASTATNQMLGSATSNADAASKAQADYQNNVVPVEDQYLNQAANYDTPEKEQEAAATAKGDVASAASQQLGATQRQQTAEGVNPASGRWAGIDRATGLGTAIAEAGGENNARQQVKTTGLGLEANAVGLGNADAGIAATDSANATSAGATAANTTNAANSQYISGTGIMNTGEAGAMTGETNAGNLLEQQYNSTLQGQEFTDQLNEQANASMMGGVGSIVGSLGAAAILASSKSYKTNKRATTGNLDAVRSMPVERWNYKPGISDGGAAGDHVGPYAEDFHKATGLGDGKSIALGDAMGVSMGAINELASKLDAVHKAIGLNTPLPQPVIPKAKQGGMGGKVRTQSVAGTKPPKLPAVKLPHVKAGKPLRLAPFHPLQRLGNITTKAA